MKKFPGALNRTPKGILLNGWQENWLRKVYPYNLNIDIANAMGISTEKLRKIAVGLNLFKRKTPLSATVASHIGKGERGNAVSKHKRATTAITIATKINRKDYDLLCQIVQREGCTKYQLLQGIIMRELNSYRRENNI